VTGDLDALNIITYRGLSPPLEPHIREGMYCSPGHPDPSRSWYGISEVECW
jgi:hypothetical protein